MNTQIKTRLAPSPTGNLHIGTARTALFNFLFAKKMGGKFIIRVEDTDRVRSKKEYEDDIIDGLKWLGISSDEPIARQTDRLDVYNKYIELMLKNKCAYEKDGAVWFSLESYKDSVIKYHDLVMGDLSFAKDQFHDFVIRKSDGIPLYMFAATVDDHDMNITHVIRGADHINSTPQQIMIYKSLGFELPEFGHIPLILNADKSKMSKRKNPVSVTADFQAKGYLPEAMTNFMALLGWNPKSEREFFTLAELTKEFDIKNVNKASAVFDIKKLNYFNNHYINQKSDEEIFDLLIQNSKVKSQNNKSKLKIGEDKKLLEKIIHVIKPRLNTLGEFGELTSYFFELPKYDPKLLIFKKSTLDITKKGLLAAYSLLLTPSNKDWESQQKLNDALSKVVADNILTNGDVFWPVRVALSGMDRSPSPIEMLWVLGKDESIKRIKKAIGSLNT